jgi:hypothetical protein
MLFVLVAAITLTCLLCCLQEVELSGSEHIRPLSGSGARILPASSRSTTKSRSGKGAAPAGEAQVVGGHPAVCKFACLAPSTQLQHML